MSLTPHPPCWDSVEVWVGLVFLLLQPEQGVCPAVDGYAAGIIGKGSSCASSWAMPKKAKSLSTLVPKVCVCSMHPLSALLQLVSMTIRVVVWSHSPKSAPPVTTVVPGLLHLCIPQRELQP